MGKTGKYLKGIILIASVFFSGCDQKNPFDGTEFAKKTSSDASSKKKKNVDVFDEFYMDDGKTATDKNAASAKKGASESSAARGSGTYKFTTNGRYVVQVNSTAIERGASKMVDKLKSMGYPAYVAQVQNPTPELLGTYFRVRIGTFDNLSEAKSFAETELASAGYEYWIDRKSNDNVGIQGAGFGQGGSNQYQAPPAQSAAPAYQAPAQAPPPQQYQPTPTPAPAPVAQPAPPTQQYQPAPAPRPAPVPAPAQPTAPPPADWGTDDWGSESW